MGVIQDLMRRVAALEDELAVKTDETKETGDAKVAKEVMAEIEALESDLAEKSGAKEVTFGTKIDGPAGTEAPKMTQESLTGLQSIEGKTDKATVPSMNALKARQAKVRDIVARLDRLADEAEKAGDSDLALEIDKISDGVEQEEGLA